MKIDPSKRTQQTSPVNQNSMGKGSESTKLAALDAFGMSVGPNMSRQPPDHEYDLADSGKNFSRFFS